MQLEYKGKNNATSAQHMSQILGVHNNQIINTLNWKISSILKKNLFDSATLLVFNKHLV